MAILPKETACGTCPFRRKFPKSIALFGLITDYLHSNKQGNFACHEDAKEVDCESARRMREEHPELNSCYGYQQMLARREQRVYITKLSDMKPQPTLDELT